MAATMWGADVEALRECAGVFEGAADQLRGSMSSVDGAFRSAPWVGSDSDTFANQWTTTQQQLEACAASLVQGASDLHRHADEQEGASTEGGGIGGPGPGPGPDGGGDDGSGTDDDDGGWWSAFKNWFTALTPVFEKIGDWLQKAGKNLAKFGRLLGRALPWIGGVLGITDIGEFLYNGIKNGDWNWGQLAEGVLGLGVAVAAIAGAIVGSPVLLAIGAIGGIGLALHSLGKLIFGDDYLSRFGSWAWGHISDFGSWAGGHLQDFGEWAWDGITDLGDSIRTGFEDFTSGVVDTFDNVTDGVSNLVDDVSSDIADTAGDVWDAVSSF